MKEASRVRRNIQGEEGFTLFLVSVLLIVAAMVAATVLQQSSRDEFWNPKTETQRKLETIAKALEYYQRTNQKLPCVASLTATSGNAAHGVKDDAQCPDGTIAIGAIPYRTLELQEEMAVDSWGNKFLYAVTTNLENSTLYMAGGAGTMDVYNESGILNGDVAFVVVSHGPDGKGAYTNRGGALVSNCASASGDDQENCDGDGVFNQFSLNQVAGADFFDDQIVWREVDYTAQNNP